MRSYVEIQHFTLFVLSEEKTHFLLNWTEMVSPLQILVGYVVQLPLFQKSHESKIVLGSHLPCVEIK